MSQSGFVLRHLVSITAFARLPARDRMNSHAPLSRHSKLLQEILVCIANSSDSSRANVSQDCISAFNDLKLAKKYKYIIFKLSDDNREIVIEEASGDKDWENFREKLIKATSKTKSGAVCKGPRYAVYDFEYSLASGEGSRNKITFIAWSPDDAGVMPKMVYASSKEGLKRSLNGVALELQANDPDDIEYDTVLKIVSKGLAG